MIRVVIADNDTASTVELGRAIGPRRGVSLLGVTGHGSRALDLVRRTHPDVVLVDLALPPLGGLALISAIAHSVPKSRVVAMSREAHPATIEAALLAGAFGHLPKGSTADEIVAAIEAALARVTHPLGIRSHGGLAMGQG
jgi:DNA-binding NarL/FixJ family response regulator